MARKAGHEQLGAEIASARLAAGFQTQAALAKALSCSPETVRSWEAGNARPRALQLPKLAQMLDLDLQVLRTRVGYEPLSPATTSFDIPFPVDTLDWDTFENFVFYLLRAKYEGEAVVRKAGTSGHTQDGLDIRVDLHDGRQLSFQCKRHKQFGPADVAEAVKAHTAPADEKHIVLSRVASPRASNAARLAQGWSIIDKNELSTMVRMDLTVEQQDRLVDIFFKGQRLALLGRTEANPWITAGEFFSPFEQRSAGLTHGWTLIGRDTELANLNLALNSQQPVAMLVGPGGTGKSRLLKEALELAAAETRAPLIRFLSPASDATPASLEALGSKKKILVVDDAHNREKLGDLIQFAANQANNAKLVLSIRPYALPRIRRELVILGVAEPPIVQVSGLPTAAACDLAREVLAKYAAPLELADGIAKVTRDCPLVTVMAARIIAQEGWSFERAKSSSELRDLILAKFADSSIDRLDAPDDHPSLKKILDVLALIQPFHIEDPRVHELLHTLKGIDPLEAPRHLKTLFEGGVIYSRQGQYWLMPDLLGDYLIERTCRTATGRLAPFATRAFAEVKDHQVKNLLLNLCRLDWRLRDESTSESAFLDEIWQSLRDIDHDWDPRLGAVEGVAVFQPRRALDFVANQIRRGRTFDRLTLSLRYASYNPQYLQEACDLLWELGKGDTRDTGPNPAHAIRVLSEMCGFEHDKAVAYSEAIFEYGMSLVSRPNAWDGRYTPLDIVKPVLSAEGSTTRNHGRSLSVTPFLVNYDVVAPTRAKLIDRLVQLLTNPIPRAASSAAETLHAALMEPRQHGSKSLRAKYRREFRATLAALKRVLDSGQCSHATALGIARSVAWHVQHGSGAVKAAAAAVLASMPSTVDFRLFAAIAGGGEDILTGRQLATGWFERHEVWLRNLRDEVRATYQPSTKLRHALENALGQLREAGQEASNAYALIHPLVDGDLGLASEIIVDAERRPDSLTRQFAAIALNRLLADKPSEGRRIVQRFLQSLDVELSSAGAAAFAHLSRIAHQDDIALLRSALVSTERKVALSAIRSLWAWKGIPKHTTIELATAANIAGSAVLADQLLLIFAERSGGFREALTGGDVRALLDKLMDLQALDGPWTEEFLSFVSASYPDEFLEFAFARLDHALTLETFEYRPINYGPWTHVNLQTFETERWTELMQRTWDRLRTHPRRDEFHFQHHVGDFFEGLARGAFGKVAAFFSDRIEAASPEDLKLIGLLLREAPPHFVFDQRDFVEQLLQRCADISTLLARDLISDLHTSAASGMRSGTLGQPKAEDVHQRDRSASALKDLARKSPAQALYAGLLGSAEANIKRALKEGEYLDDA